jgi:hypothetical protein
MDKQQVERIDLGRGLEARMNEDTLVLRQAQVTPGGVCIAVSLELDAEQAYQLMCKLVDLHREALYAASHGLEGEGGQ